MEAQKPPQLSLIEQLPVELIEIILSALPDLHSLKGAALCCPRLFDVFKGAESTIATKVLTLQLGCIHDFLVRAVSPAFIDVAEHDVAWGEFSVQTANDIDSEYVQYLLSLGLEKLYAIWTAKTYETRYELMNNPQCNCPWSRYDFLHEALDEMSNEPNDHIYLSDYTLDDQRRNIKPSYFKDPDSGPAEVWRWAHQDETRSNFVYQRHREVLREWAYVMWDSCRLNEWGVFQKPWDHEDTWKGEIKCLAGWR
ncbi:hypothetical protein EJ08DRAFT_663853 [Tothia fuscella]|uniref:F-box domain-containing protein n=1 Tax=Tothia fuscella TaxID=1048955 RepID=A0A9P4NKG4_9PEZI|nr:hypothetical protein EJ08DRAFT_663853 [Tothia fuscella]